MKFKRFATMALAGAMSLSLAVPAFAQSTEVTAAYSSPTISVDVPTKGAVIINPFGLDVEMAEDAADTANTNKVTISGQKIVTAPMALKNKTKMTLGVNVTLTGTVAATSDMRLAAEPLAADDTSKSAFVYLQAAPSTLAGATSAVTATAVATAFAAWEPAAYSANNDLILGTRAASKENIVTLKAAKMDSNGAFEEYKAGSIAFVRLAGDAVASPRTAWTDDDGFTANIAYTFAPVVIPTFGITVGTYGNDGTASNASGMTFEVNGEAATKAAAGDTVTVKVTADNKADTIDWTVVDEKGTAIAGLSGTGETADQTTKVCTFTFTMPAQAVTVNVVSNA